MHFKQKKIINFKKKKHTLLFKPIQFTNLYYFDIYI